MGEATATQYPTVTTITPPTRADDNHNSRLQASVSIIVPTRNEADNIARLLTAIEESMPSGHTEVIFVDDSSDNTPEVVRDASLHSPLSIRIIHRPPGARDGGLSGAVLVGCRAASAPWTCVMDADLQHSPEVITQLVNAAVNSQADVVIASRYVRGGSAHGLGTASRKVISHASRWLAKAMFPERLWRIADPCAGFFLVRTDLLHGCELRPIGFKILLEVLMRSNVRRVVEVPYRFESRAAGQSKATFAQGKTFLQHLARLWIELPGAGRYSKFALVGASGILINLGLLFLAAKVFDAHKWIAWCVGVEASIAWNFLLNHRFTWADRIGGGVFRRMGAYQAVATIALGLNAVIFATLTAAGTDIMAAGLAGIIGAIAINFVGADKLVFSRLLSASPETKQSQS